MLLSNNTLPHSACKINDGVHTSLRKSTHYIEMCVPLQNIFVVASCVSCIDHATKFYFLLIFVCNCRISFSTVYIYIFFHRTYTVLLYRFICILENVTQTG